MLNNYSGAENGFLEVINREKEILLEINKLLILFRERSRLSVQNEKMYLISLIPFMRAYANLIGNSVCYKRLSKVMHGYETKELNITYVYNQLFCKSGTKISNSYTISVKDILKIDINDIGDIVKKSDYPLLNKTLYHSVCYLYLRMKTESVLCKKFRIKKSENNKALKLSTIIDKTLNENNFESDDERQFIKYAKAKLVSKKTLLNEFNHFEGNMNIFQPAIDISDVMLNKEINEILLTLEKVNELKIKK